ncbi:MAG: BON domain-containing protein [Isosphaeraceae bacterium]|nr:BON domain-containing protein [Isosphaeraceae bacterium]
MFRLDDGTCDDPSPPGGAAALRSAIGQRLHESPYAALHDVECDDCRAFVRLRGRLPSQYLKQLALEAACALSGRLPIVNEIEVTGHSRVAVSPSGPASWRSTAAMT